jgi:BMFP domain-containing protein YqiC
MTRKTRERLEYLEKSLHGGRDVCIELEARITALEDSLEAAEAQIEERKAENKYLHSLLVMLQSGVDARKGPTV